MMLHQAAPTVLVADKYSPHRIAEGIPIGAGKACNGNCHICLQMPADTACHSGRNRLGYRAMG